MRKKFIVSSILITASLLIFGGVLSALATVETGWSAGKANICKTPTDGFIDFEEGTEGAVILSTIPGLQFTTTYGINWRYGDIRTGNYNVYPYGAQAYETNGNFFAWLGTTGDTGRIDFTEGTATYLSVLASTYSGLTLEAYDANGNLIATSGWATNNFWTRTFTRLTVEAPLGKTIAYVMIHDWGNYWLIDDLCTDAPGVPPAYKQVAELAKEVIDANYLWGGKGYYYKINRFATSREILEQGYNYYNPILKKIDFGKGLDCSGLSFWSYNRTYSGGEIITWKTCVDEEKCPLYYEGAHGQYKSNTERIEKDELRVGDLLFFDVCITKTGKCDPSKKVNDNVIDHVAMYIGPFTYEGKEFNTVHASGFTGTITPAYYSFETEELLTIKLTGIKQFLKVYNYGRVAEFKLAMEIIAKSPVNLIVIDPDGQTVDIANTLLTEDGYTQEVDGMSYMIRDVDGDGDIEDIVAISERKIGDYLIQVVPEPDALPTDTYTLMIEALVNGEIVTIVLAENIPISDIPRTPYIIRATETEIIPIIPTFVDFDPNTLNLKSKGQWLTVYLELPVGYDVNEINLESIKLNGQISVEAKPTEVGDYDGNGVPDLMVKFNRAAVQDILEVGEKVKITISGNLIDGRPLEGSDIIRVINEGEGEK